MASKSVNLILIAVFAVIICSSLTESASTRHHTSQRIARSSEKAAEGGDVTPQVNPGTCSDNTPCGWAVYTRFTRVVDYFMKNTCTCKTGLECIRVDDDVSVSAYIYKCREVPNRNSKGGDGATS